MTMAIQTPLMTVEAFEPFVDLPVRAVFRS